MRATSLDRPQVLTPSSDTTAWHSALALCPPRATLAAVTMLLLRATLGPAQSATPPKVFYACYVPSAGTVYRIKEPGLLQACLTKPEPHVQFSWTDGASAVRAGDAAGGDLGGTFPNPSVLKLLGRAIATLAPTDGQVYAWDAANNQWTPTAPTLAGPAGGDLAGTYPNPGVAKLQGTPVSPTAPTAGQVLTFNGTAWAPADATTASSATGQSATTVATFGTTTIDNSTLTALPGLSMGVTVPSSATLVLIATDGGASVAQLAGTSPTVNYSVVDVTVLIDGRGTGYVRRLTIQPVASGPAPIENWSETFATSLSPGSHLVQVAARLVQGSAALVGGDSSTVLRGTLTVSVINP